MLAPITTVWPSNSNGRSSASMIRAGELPGRLGIGHAEMDHRELVAAEPGDHVTLRGQLPQSGPRRP